MRILIVDDHALFREGLANLLRAQPEVEVVGEASAVAEAVEQVRLLHPDLVLMDFSLPDGTGVEATRQIMAERPEIRIVVLTAHEAEDRLLAAIQAGARGYLLKNLPVNKLMAALRSLEEEDEYALSRKMSAQVIAGLTSHGPRLESYSAPADGFSLRELDILRLLASNASNREIAEALDLSETTVKNHVHTLLAKLQVKNRQDAAQLAQSLGLLE